MLEKVWHLLGDKTIKYMFTGGQYGY